MQRRTRIIVEIVAPSFLGALLPFVFWAVVQGWSGQFLLLQIQDLGVSFFWACLFGAPPSVVYMIIMESRFARGLDPRSWRAVGLSTLLGLGAGLAIALVLVLVWWPDVEVPITLGGAGAATGFVLGLLIRRFSAPKVRG